MNDIAKKIMLLMQEKNITYVELSKATGISKSALQRYATGETVKIPLDRLELIAKALDVSTAFLLGWKEAHDISENDRSLKDVFLSNACSILGKRAESESHVAQVSIALLNDVSEGRKELTYLNALKLAEIIGESFDVLFGFARENEPAPRTGDELDEEIISLLDALPKDKKKAGVDYLRFLASHEDT